MRFLGCALFLVTTGCSGEAPPAFPITVHSSHESSESSVRPPRPLTTSEPEGPGSQSATSKAKTADCSTLAALLRGCGPSKDEECNALIEIVNDGIEEIEKATQAKGTDALKSMASAMEKVSVRVEKLELSVDELRELASKYREMAIGVAKHARAMAAAGDAKDLAKMKSAQTELTAASSVEDSLVGGINRTCGFP